jgi:vancomycin permeability regulator SanA
VGGAVKDGAGFMPSCFVIFGALLKPDGSAGPALMRRVRGALAAARDRDDAVFLVTGAQPRAGITEAAVMRRLLREAGISDDRILVEAEAHNTRSSAIACAAMLKGRPELRPVLVCSDRFHQARCVMLLRLCGIPAAPASMPDERSEMRPQIWLFYRMRELVAIPYDALMIVLRRR